MSSPLAAIVLAAGQGTRMHSAHPKVIHRLLGQPLVHFPILRAREVGAEPIVVVVGHGAQAVLASLPAGVMSAEQPEQLGTADAVRVGIAALGDFDGSILVLSGDVPLLPRAVLERLLLTPGPVSLVVASARNPRGYGRIVRGPRGLIERIVEERDASPTERSLREVNAGLYRFDAQFLRRSIHRVSPGNAQKELYLTDLVALAALEEPVTAVVANLEEVAGINDRLELSRAAAVLRRQINARHQLAGVTLVDPDSTLIEPTVVLGRDVTVGGGCVLLGNTRIADAVTILPHSVLENAEVGPDCIIGPFARLRPGTRLESGVHIGNFVELKNAHLGEGTKAGHLTYLGDAEIGRKVNVGAGTITCNYDGAQKHLTRIGDGVFIGSDTQLVAPVTVGDGAYIGAGSTVQGDVPADSLVLTRAPRILKENWAKKRRGE